MQVTRVGVDIISVFFRAVVWSAILFTLNTADLLNYIKHWNAQLYPDDCQLHLSYDLFCQNVVIGLQNTDLKVYKKVVHQTSPEAQH